MLYRLGWSLFLSLSFLGGALPAQQATPGNVNKDKANSAAVASIADQASEDQIREYLSLTGAVKLSHNEMAAALDAMQTTAVPYLPASYWADMKAEFLKMDVASIFVPVYQRYFSHDDMQAVINFYRSPAGKKVLNLQPMVIRDGEVAMRKRGGEIGQAVYARHQDEIEAGKRKYEAEHGVSPSH